MRRLMSRARLLLFAVGVLALAGCMSAPQQTGTRDQNVPMSSIAGFDLSRFSGRWYEVQAYAEDGGSCVIGAVTFTPQRSGNMIVTEGPCADGTPRTGQARRTAPGQFTFQGDALWVLWVDQSYQTAVIGSPSGAAHILSRRLDIPTDKLVAAREILDWNGFDLSRLHATRRK